LTGAQRRWLAGGLSFALAIGTVTAVADSASAAATPTVPAGIYLESPWVAPGGTGFLDHVNTTSCDTVQSAAFVDAGGSTQIAHYGLGDSYWPVTGFELRDPVTDAPLPIGMTGPASGNLVLTCVPAGGGATTTVSLPLVVSATQPSTIYNSATAFTYFTPGNITPGAQVTINALGFKPGESTTVTLVNDTLFNNTPGDLLSAAVATPMTAIADGEGAVTAQVIVPSGWTSADSLSVLVAGASSRYLLISGSGTPTNGDPSLNLTDTVSAFSGGAVTVAAGGFVAGETVVVALHSATARAVQLGTMTADSAGLISGSVYLPTGLSSGSYKVWAGAKVISYLLLNTPLVIGSAPTTTRIAGTDRYQTAVATSQSFAPFATGTGTVYLTSGEAFPDALGAGALAAEIGAPVLLTSPGSLPNEVNAELLRLHPAHIKVVGGTSAISPAVFADVQSLSFAHDTTRLGGTDRFNTNRLLISNALTHASTVYIAVGSNFPDALAAGPAAATVGGAVILVNGSAGMLDQPTLALLTSLGVTHVRLVGGTSAISTGIQSQLNTLYPGNVIRLAGTDRFSTAEKIVAGAWPTTAAKVILASGANFPDALAAGALGLPMLPSHPTCIPAVVLARLGALKPTTLTLVGGTSALIDNVSHFAHC
jgi:putative cell wall-binding protein